ncbi:MAG: hypothetical protein D6757_07775 [Alphaproteobacteria bacterium]|nr:MAG: hypothetical protein D6757_07775 [Alphaproteobacteria bacterium]
MTATERHSQEFPGCEFPRCHGIAWNARRDGDAGRFDSGHAGLEFDLSLKGHESMYVCVCNAIREAEFRSAAADLAHEASVKRVFRRLERQPRCGTCLTYARRLLDEFRSSRSLVDANGENGELLPACTVSDGQAQAA